MLAGLMYRNLVARYAAYFFEEVLYGCFGLLFFVCSFRSDGRGCGEL